MKREKWCRSRVCSRQSRSSVQLDSRSVCDFVARDKVAQSSDKIAGVTSLLDNRFLYGTAVSARARSFAVTVDDSKNSPEQEDDDNGQSFFTLGARDALDEHQIERERRHDYCTVEHLQRTTQPYRRYTRIHPFNGPVRDYPGEPVPEK